MKIVKHFKDLTKIVTAYIISYRFSYKVSLMVSFVMLIPHVIYILGVNWAQKLSIVVGMDINRLFNTYGYNVKSIILLIVVFVIMLVINKSLVAKYYFRF